MDLFGHNILDFPDDNETLFSGRLPRISESEYFQDLGLDDFVNHKVKEADDDERSNDSAVFSEDFVGSDDASSEVPSSNDDPREDDLDILNDDEDRTINHHGNHLRRWAAWSFHLLMILLPYILGHHCFFCPFYFPQKDFKKI